MGHLTLWGYPFWMESRFSLAQDGIVTLRSFLIYLFSSGYGGVAVRITRCGYQLFRHTAAREFLGAVVDIPIRTALVCDVFVLVIDE